MSDNPFNSPSNVLPNSPQITDVPQATPGALTAICIICLVFGLLGSCGACINGLVSGFQSQITDAVNTALPDGPDKDLQLITMAAQKTIMIPGLILMALKLIVGLMMFVTAIGCLKKKESSRSLLRTSLLGACVCSVLGILLGIYSLMVLPAAMTAELQTFADSPNFIDIEALVNRAIMFQYIGAGVGSVIALAVLGFYFWSRGYLNRPEIVKLFS